MKKLLILLLVCFMLVGATSCAMLQVEPAASADSAASDSEAPSGSDGTVSSPDGGDETPQPRDTVVKLNSATQNLLRFTAREVETQACLNCNHAGAGFEIRIRTTAEKVVIKARASASCAFRIFVDGEAWENADGSVYHQIRGVRDIELNGIPVGEHTIRVIRVSDDVETEASFYNITFQGEQLPITQSTASMLIEFVGDGITAGAGLGTDTADVTQAYPYLVANALNADYAVEAFTGMGVSVGTTIPSLYGKNSYFGTGADIVVLNVGTEDFAQSVTETAFTSAYQSLLSKIKTNNGPACKIVCVSTSSNSTMNGLITKICNQLGGASKGYYAKTLTPASDAPTAAQHQAYATALAAYIESIKSDTLDVVSLKSKAQGYGFELDFHSADWNLN